MSSPESMGKRAHKTVNARSHQYLGNINKIHHLSYIRVKEDKTP